MRFKGFGKREAEVATRHLSNRERYINYINANPGESSREIAYAVHGPFASNSEASRKTGSVNTALYAEARERNAQIKNKRLDGANRWYPNNYSEFELVPSEMTEPDPVAAQTKRVVGRTEAVTRYIENHPGSTNREIADALYGPFETLTAREETIRRVSAITSQKFSYRHFQRVASEDGFRYSIGTMPKTSYVKPPTLAEQAMAYIIKNPGTTCADIAEAIHGPYSTAAARVAANRKTSVRLAGLKSRKKLRSEYDPVIGKTRYYRKYAARKPSVTLEEMNGLQPIEPKVRRNKKMTEIPGVRDMLSSAVEKPAPTPASSVFSSLSSTPVTDLAKEYLWSNPLNAEKVDITTLKDFVAWADGQK